MENDVGFQQAVRTSHGRRPPVREGEGERGGGRGKEMTVNIFFIFYDTDDCQNPWHCGWGSASGLVFWSKYNQIKSFKLENFLSF